MTDSAAWQAGIEGVQEDSIKTRVRRSMTTMLDDDGLPRLRMPLCSPLGKALSIDIMLVAPFEKGPGARGEILAGRRSKTRGSCLKRKASM